MKGYILYSKTLPNERQSKRNKLESTRKENNPKVEDRYIVNDDDVAKQRIQWEITVKQMKADQSFFHKR